MKLNKYSLYHIFLSSILTGIFILFVGLTIGLFYEPFTPTSVIFFSIGVSIGSFFTKLIINKLK